MPSIVQGLFGLAAALHVVFFSLESLLFMRPDVHVRFGLRTVEEATVVRPMAFNQGFYNLFLAAGMVVGLVLAALGHAAAGQACAIFAASVMTGAAVILLATDRRFVVAAALQGLPPLLGLVLLAIG